MRAARRVHAKSTSLPDPLQLLKDEPWRAQVAAAHGAPVTRQFGAFSIRAFSMCLKLKVIRKVLSWRILPPQLSPATRDSCNSESISAAGRKQKEHAPPTGPSGRALSVASANPLNRSEISATVPLSPRMSFECDGVNEVFAKLLVTGRYDALPMVDCSS